MINNANNMVYRNVCNIYITTNYYYMVDRKGEQEMSIFEDSIKVYKNMAKARTQDCINYQKEIERLKETLDSDEDVIKNQDLEIERLNNIIKEVREYIEDTYKDYKNEDGTLPMTLHDQELLEILEGEDNE